MKRLFVAAFLALLVVLPARAADHNLPTTPAPRDPRWVARHQGFVEIAKKGDVDLLFVGDSITDFWRSAGKSVWETNFAPLHAANFGISGDRTQHVLWRLQNGELDGIKPKLVVLMIGTNNLLDNPDDQIAAGIKAILQEFQTKTPAAKVLLLAVFPRSENADAPARTLIKALNAKIAKFADGKNVKYLDIGDKFLEPDGSLSPTVMPDFLHPNAKGYQIWAAAILPTVQEMMK